MLRLPLQLEAGLLQAIIEHEISDSQPNFFYES